MSRKLCATSRTVQWNNIVSFRHLYCLLSLSMLMIDSVHGRTSWLLEHSFQSKPIYYLRDDVAKSPQDIGKTCREQLDYMLNQRPITDKWAFDMMDSNAVLPSGLMRQQFTSVGSYKQCLAIRAHHQNEQVKGKYCFLTFTISNSTTDIVSQNERDWIKDTYRVNHRFRFAFGLCIPDACTKKEIETLFKNSVELKDANFQKLKLSLCQSDKEQTFIEYLAIHNNLIVFPILMVAVIFAVLGTLWHIFGLNSHHWMMYFSLIRNTKAVFNQADPPRDTLEYRYRFLHGFRNIASFWIFVAHAGSFLPSILVMPISYVARHPYDMMNFIRGNLFANLISNGFYAVQTFFFISGFLMTSLIIKKNMAKQLTLFTFIGLRWIRFSVPLLGVIVLHKTLFMFWKGPFFTPEVIHYVYRACNNENFWKEFLFTTNFANTSCIRTSWYLSADLQIHFIAFTLIILLRKKLYKALYCLSFFYASLSVIVPTILLYIGFSTMDITSYFDNYHIDAPLRYEVQYLYFTPYMHMGIFFYGAILGTILMTKQDLFKRYYRPLFILSFIGMLGAAFFKEGPSSEYHNSHFIRGMIIGVGFFFWNIGLGMVSYQLALPEVPKHALWLSKFLTHPVHRPFSRLSFGIYLTQFTTLILNFSLVEDVHNISLHTSVTFSLTCLIETLILSWCLFVLFESPIHHFVKSLMGRNKNTDNKPIIYMPTKTDQEMMEVDTINNNHEKKDGFEA